MSQINQRLVFQNAKRALVRAGVNPQTAILSQSYLRLEAVASTSVTNYQFGVLVNDAPQGRSQRATENRLNLQDAFYCSQIQIFTGLATSATDTAFSLDSWPNPFKYTTAGAADALNNLYNGYLSLTVNNRVITPSWDILRHLDVPQTQQNAAAASGVNTDQFSGIMTASATVEPNFVLIGSKNNNLTINLPGAIGTLQAGSTTIIAIVMRGVLAQNVTPVQ